MEPLDGELAVAFHWVMKIVVMIACVVGFGVLGAGIGISAGFLAAEMGALGSGGGAAYGGYALLFGSMLVFGILGAALGGYVGNKIIRSKFK